MDLLVFTALPQKLSLNLGGFSSNGVLCYSIDFKLRSSNTWQATFLIVLSFKIGFVVAYINGGGFIEIDRFGD